MSPQFWDLKTDIKVLGINSLMEAKRFTRAMDECSDYMTEVASDYIVNVLKRMALEESIEVYAVNDYHVTRLFETLDKNGDVDENTLGELEWMYLPMLASYGSYRKPKLLHNQLALSPEFFIDVVKVIFISDEDLQELKNNPMGFSPELLQIRAERAYELLQSWKKVPGTNDDDDVLDEAFLEQWVMKARELGEKAGILEGVDNYIGKIFAQYPEKILPWPPETICKLIESINSHEINISFSAALFNKRGSSSRGPYEGGNIERGHSKYFKELYDLHHNKYPRTASIFEKLSIGYNEDAKKMDDYARKEESEH
jgi:hypothetical protein